MKEVIAGIFKFRTQDPEYPTAPDLMELESLAQEWLEQADFTVDYLHIRQCGDNQTGIEFRCQLKDKDKLSRFVYRMTDKLKRKFGNDLVAWDIAHATVIK